MSGPVFLTGDVHQMSCPNGDHPYLDGTEMEAALECAEIAASHDVALTLFCTGRAITDESGIARRLAAMPNVELGGHTWNAFERRWLHYAFRVAFGSFYGPTPYQRRDVERTLSAFEADLETTPRSWRGHAFSGGDRTERVLRETPVAVVSNAVGPRASPRELDGLFSLPVNTRPDHDNVYHGPFTERAVRRDERIRTDGFGGFLALDRPYSRSDLRRLGLEIGKTVLGIETWDQGFDRAFTPVDGWVDRVQERVDRHLTEEGPGFATVLAHPACQAVADDLAAFERLCAWLSAYDTRPVGQAPTVLSG